MPDISGWHGEKACMAIPLGHAHQAAWFALRVLKCQNTCVLPV